MWKWQTEGQQLYIQDDDCGERYLPMANQVFAALSCDFSGNHFPNSGMQHSPEIDLPDIRFSQLEAHAEIVLSIDDQKNINLHVKAVRGKKQVEVLTDISSLKDHILIGNTWYHMATAFAGITELLKAVSITKWGHITLNQYLMIKKHTLQNNMLAIQDNAEEELDNHTVTDCSTAVPPEIRATLYPYQETGFRWMQFVTNEGCGCILGDEMGLGKTLQVIALITARRQKAETPALVIAPVSLLENWRREISKFSPVLQACVHHGSHRSGRYIELLKYDVVIISYNTSCSDQALLKMINWDILVLDEAQAIKNPTAMRTHSVKHLLRRSCVAVTGTPFENHMSDLWSIVDFIMPGSLGTLKEFNQKFPDDADGAHRLEPFITPLLLRRNVKEVAGDLPERVDIPQVLKFSEADAITYDQIREAIVEELGEQKAALPLLQRLRMYCTHPFVSDPEATGDPLECSPKYERMCEILQEVISLREKAILFTSYNSMFTILEKDIPKRFCIPVMSINGATPPDKRQEIVDQFSAINGSALLVLNPRAAGTGLNITAASRVIHYNLEWNPALEDQASARAYRRGQTRTVFVYRLYYGGTVEEVINDRIEKKRLMFENAIIGVDGSTSNTEDIMRALSMSPKGEL